MNTLRAWSVVSEPFNVKEDSDSVPSGFKVKNPEFELISANFWKFKANGVIKLFNSYSDNVF